MTLPAKFSDSKAGFHSDNKIYGSKEGSFLSSHSLLLYNKFISIDKANIKNRIPVHEDKNFYIKSTLGNTNIFIKNSSGPCHKH